MSRAIQKRQSQTAWKRQQLSCLEDTLQSVEVLLSHTVNSRSQISNAVQILAMFLPLFILSLSKLSSKPYK